MSLLDEDTVHLFNRAYCYLRLSGFSAEESFIHLKELPYTLFVAGDTAALWASLIQKSTQHSSTIHSLHPQPLPAIVRGHMGYPAHGV